MWRDANVGIWVTPQVAFSSIQMLFSCLLFNYKSVPRSFVYLLIKTHACLKAWPAWLLEPANAWWQVGLKSKRAGFGAMDYVRAEPKAVLKHSHFCRAFYIRTIDLIPQISGCWLSSPSCSTQSSAVDLLQLGRWRMPHLPARLFGHWGFLKTLVVLERDRNRIKDNTNS